MKNQKEITISSYNKTAHEYYKVVSEFDILPEVFEFAEMMKLPGKILDLGCGPGHHAKFFSDRGFNVVGIDLSETMIEIAKQVAPKVHFEVMDISSLTFLSSSFDGIWASASLLHIPKNEISFVIQNIYYILKTDGIIYISLKLGESENLFNDHRYGGVEKFYVYYRPNEIEDILHKVGFSVLHHGLRGKRSNYDTNSWMHIFLQKK